MKRFCALCLVLLCCLSACGNTEQEEIPTTALTPEELAAAALAGQAELPTLYATRPADADYAAALPLYLQELPAEDGVLCRPFGVNATEAAVFRLADPQTAHRAEETLQAYLTDRVALFRGYAPEHAALAEKGRVVVCGCYAALLICADSAAAEEAFLRCFMDTPPDVQPTFAAVPSSSEAPPETPEPTESTEPPDVYDHDAVLRAWQSGDDSALSAKNRAVLEAAKGAIASLISDGMTDLEKEHAIHDWLVVQGDYDRAELSELPGGTPDPDHDNPYGFLIHGVGICSGYTATFQLFMDMLDIPCLSVQGETDWGEAHAWNLVRLGGDWFCVDLTWDDPVDMPPIHDYLNVTSAVMRLSGHIWDETAVPEAITEAPPLPAGPYCFS